jgi:hypothetical protein
MEQRKYTSKNNLLFCESERESRTPQGLRWVSGKIMCAAWGTSGTCPRWWRSSRGQSYQSAFPWGLRREGEVGITSISTLRVSYAASTLRVSYAATSETREEQPACRHVRDPHARRAKTTIKVVVAPKAVITSKVLAGSATMLSRLNLLCGLEQSHAAEQ